MDEDDEQKKEVGISVAFILGFFLAIVKKWKEVCLSMYRTFFACHSTYITLFTYNPAQTPRRNTFSNFTLPPTHENMEGNMDIHSLAPFFGYLALIVQHFP